MANVYLSLHDFLPPASLFLPFAAATLLWLNNGKRILGNYVNSLGTNLMLAACLFVFAIAAIISVWHPYT